ncbi:MAG: hypothetical protein NC110_00500 [Ruminococcus sp.]|nr:hypothetical protein [Ruminococcus sp.]
MKKSICLIVATLCLLFCLFTIGCTADRTDKKSSLINEPGTTEFLPISKSEDLLDDVFCPDIQIKSNYIFIQLNEFVLRYDMELKAYDKFFKLASCSEDEAIAVTFSSDGQYSISYTYNSINGYGDRTEGGNFILTDIKSQTSKLIAKKYDESAGKALRKQLPSELQMEYYDFEFPSEGRKSDFRATSKVYSKYFESVLSEVITAEEISYMLVSDEMIIKDKAPASTKLGNLRLVVIDLKADKIIDECCIIEIRPTTTADVTTASGKAKFLSAAEFASLHKLPFKDFESSIFLKAEPGFCFITLNEYTVRYSIANKDFDKHIKLGDSSDCKSFKSTFSSSGQYIINSHERTHNSIKFTLINLKDNSSQIISGKGNKNLADAVKALIPPDATGYYDFEFSNDVYKTDLLAKSKCFEQYRSANKIIDFSAANDQTVYILNRDKVSDYVKLGDLRLVAIDLKADKIIDERYIIEK